MNPKYFTLKEVRLSNNCPECYSNEGLKLTFKQQFAENRFYRSITDHLINELHCLNCDTPIFPGRWTREIDQVIDYQKRAVQPRAKSTKLKTATWALMIFGLVLLIVGLLLGMRVFKF